MTTTDLETESATSMNAWLSCRAKSKAELVAPGEDSLAKAETETSAANSAPRQPESIE